MKPVVFFLLMLYFGTVSFIAPAQSAGQRDSMDKKNTAIILQDGDFITKATVSKKDSIISIIGRLGPGYSDYRIFGYKKNDSRSRKMILISIFTDDVKNNPFLCPFGAYYQTSDMKNMQLKYLSKKGCYIKAAIIKEDKQQATVYIEKKWIAFE
jgi:hypothetical protein